AAALADSARRLLGHQPGLGQRFAGGDLHFQPLAEAVFVAPNPAHLRPRVSRDHRIASGAEMSGMCMGTVYCTWPLRAATNPGAAQVICAPPGEFRSQHPCHTAPPPPSPTPNIARSPNSAITSATSCALARKPRAA